MAKTEAEDGEEGKRKRLFFFWFYFPSAIVSHSIVSVLFSPICYGLPKHGNEKQIIK
jgi:hypothetical protein